MSEVINHSGDFIMVRAWQVKLCSPLGPSKGCGAALLARFEFWHNGNKINAKKHGLAEGEYVTLSIQDIKRFLFDQWSVNTIQKSIDFLLGEGLISKKDNGDGKKCSYKLIVEKLNQFANHIKSDTVVPYNSPLNHVKNDIHHIKSDTRHVKNDIPTMSNLIDNHIKSDTQTISNLICNKEYKEIRIKEEDNKEDVKEGAHRNSVVSSTDSEVKLKTKEEGQDFTRAPETTQDVANQINHAGLFTDTAENRIATWKIIEPFLQTESFKDIWSMSADRYPDADPEEVVKDWTMLANWQEVKQFKINKISGWIRVNHETKNKANGTTSNNNRGRSQNANDKSQNWRSPTDPALDKALLDKDIADYKRRYLGIT